MKKVKSKLSLNKKLVSQLTNLNQIRGGDNNQNTTTNTTTRNIDSITTETAVSCDEITGQVMCFNEHSHFLCFGIGD